jgi:hypothetical protein
MVHNDHRKVLNFQLSRSKSGDFESNRIMHMRQGCQTFIDTIYQTGEKLTKDHKIHIPDSYKIKQMKYTKRS